MAKPGDILVFHDGKEMLVANNKLPKMDENYKMFDDSRIILVNMENGHVELHYRDFVPYEDGLPYIPMYGGVVKVIKKQNRM
ncbi:hypothetical protein Slash_2 [Bacillus phage Slash]|uniref:Uncharacterized protein n=2 Tax=Slashvirus TaxID=1921709 RepID=U5PXF6_9CAUD|nr:hypothetical protein Staley_2 [Bacillus phage Staley]YP_008771904.1 hypothetical protein Slash_2 [Bacillus phage Slash]AGY48291.1 hypothetical protein Slash_2 [Bacillus phage Slash]AGY48685.1 hypothetical protein Staley_2 [Bacillus phage Staley]